MTTPSKASMTKTPTMKELLLHSGTHQCMVEVSATDTLSTVRTKVLEEFDEDMLPFSTSESREDFYMCMGGIRLSRKQESTKLCWDILEANRELTLHAKNSTSSEAQTSNLNGKRPSKSTSAENHESEQDKPTKKPRSSGSHESTDNNNSQVKRKENVPPEAANSINYSQQHQHQHSYETPHEVTTMAETATNNNNDNAVDDHPPSLPTKKLLYDHDTPMAIQKGSSEDEQNKTAEPKKNKETPTEGTSNSTRKDDKESTTTTTTKNDGSDDNDLIMTASDDYDDDISAAPTGTNNNDDDLQVTQVVDGRPKNNPHEKYDNALTQSCEALKEVDQLLKDPENKMFCSDVRRKEWSNDIARMLKRSTPDTIIGCLGSTGVGKSSLLNALLDEAAVLPTSGSRGCTAAVVELRFNRDLYSAVLVEEGGGNSEKDVYKGQIEFMTLKEWHDELKLLIDECSTHDSQTIYVMPPEEQRQPDAAAAWAKIDQVYGHGTMSSMSGRAKTAAWNRLSQDGRVVRLLTPPVGSTSNTIVVKEGTADAAQAKLLMDPLSGLKGKLRRAQKKWAKSFRAKINDYVYRKGNGGGPQTWPLIRKVVLHGPWAVLSTGACLVDLPGVRDANAARARVAQNYLQCCNKIWIVAPIKRAVDDGTAKELLGEQFKRRMLMDGNYGNISFICSQTDDCESTEIMRDHQDVAERVEGRWEKMKSILDEINSLDKDRSNLLQEEDDLKVDLEETDSAIVELKEEIKEMQDDLDDSQALEALKASLKEKKRSASALVSKRHAWKTENSATVKTLEEKSRHLQRRLKAICAIVRNEYSTQVLQEDFRAGLEELTRRPDDEERDGRNAASATDENTPSPLPDNFQLEVQAISSNDYLKITGVKPASDGPPNTFDNVNDTQIPALRAAVHKTTAQFKIQFTESFLNNASDMLDRVKLCATENQEDSASSLRLKQAFHSEMKSLDSKVSPIVSKFIKKAESKVNATLRPSLQNGAAKANTAAMSTVTSWGSKNRRTRNFRSLEQNGLYWSTYNATVRRNGTYTSGAAGAIDFNQELCDPCEEEFSSDWQRIMDGAIGILLAESEREIEKAFHAVAQAVVSSFISVGMDVARVQTMANTASRTCTTALKNAFAGMREVATNAQRDLNRSLLPKVTSRMEEGYMASNMAERGAGRFSRMKSALENHAQRAVRSMFDEATTELLAAVGGMVKQIASMIMGTVQVITQSLSSVYSVCWDDQQNKAALLDPALQQQTRACRDKLLPDLNRLRQVQDATMALVGIERQEVEFDVVGVDTWEERNAKEMKEAKSKGSFIDLCDSDDDDNEKAMLATKPAATAAIFPKVKAEPGTKAEAEFRKSFEARLKQVRRRKRDRVATATSPHHRFGITSRVGVASMPASSSTPAAARKISPSTSATTQERGTI